jgi:hypothetical protein
MMEFPYPISEMLLWVLMLDAVGVIYLGAGVSLSPFSADHPPLVGHPFTEMVLEPLDPPSMVEWSWIVAPPSRTLELPALAIGPPLVAALAPLVIPAPVVHALEIGGGSRRHQRSPTRRGWSPPCQSSPQRCRFESPSHFFVFVAASDVIVLIACRGFPGRTLAEAGSLSGAEPPRCRANCCRPLH